MEKLISYIIVVLLSVFVIFSCDDFLELDYKSEATRSQFWKTSTNVEQGVAAIYDNAQAFFESNYLRYGEFRSGNIGLYERGSASQDQINNNQLTINANGADWGDLYKGINAANSAIKNIPDVPAFTGKNDLLGQAYGLRALFYFYAVKIWGDVPHITDPFTEENINQVGLYKSRSPASEILNDIIIPDLNKAEQLISQSNRLGYIDIGAILSLKAYVYMWPGKHQNYTTALDAISQLQDLGYYKLETTQSGWISMFRDGEQNSNEIIFKLEWNFDDDGNNSGVDVLSATNGQYQIPGEVRQIWPKSDFRRNVSFRKNKSDITIQQWNTPNKYSGDDWESIDARGNWGGRQGTDWVFYRLSGLLLLKAEAENYLGHPQKALVLVNKIREARGLEQVDETITNKTKVRDIILKERRWELYAEGHRFWDLVRNGVAVERLETLNDPKKIYWPVSQNVLNRNPEISQTGGY